MRQLPRFLTVARFRLRLVLVQGVLAGAVLLILGLGVSGSFFSAPAASAAPAEAAVSAFKPRPTRTRMPPIHTPTPTPTPTATAAPVPTATPMKKPVAAITAVGSGTARSGAGGGGSAGSGDGGADAPLGSLLVWGLGALVIALLGFGGFIVLFSRRAARGPQQPAFAPPARQPTRARLNQLHQLLPARPPTSPPSAEDTVEPMAGEDDAWTPLLSPQEAPPSAPIKPPRWLIDAGLLKDDTGELPAQEPPEP